MKKIVLAALVLMGVNGFADGYQSGWKVYERPQPGVTYGGSKVNPYGPGGGNSYGPGGSKNIANPWKVSE